MPRILALLALFAALAWGGDADPAALQGVLDRWKTAWNDADVGKTIALFHPDAKTTKRLAKEGAKEKYVANTTNFKNQLGSITAIEAVKFSETGKSWIAKVTYDKMGVVIASFAVAQDAQGTWMLKSFNITGNGEPEVSQLQPPKPPAEPAPEGAK